MRFWAVDLEDEGMVVHPAMAELAAAAPSDWRSWRRLRRERFEAGFMDAVELIEFAAV